MKFLTRHNIWKKKIELRIEYWGLEWFYYAKELELKWVSYLLLLPAYRPQIVLDCSYSHQTLPLTTCFQFSIRSWKKMVLNWIYAIKVTTMRFKVQYTLNYHIRKGILLYFICCNTHTFLFYVSVKEVAWNKFKLEIIVSCM